MKNILLSLIYLFSFSAIANNCNIKLIEPRVHFESQRPSLNSSMNSAANAISFKGYNVDTVKYINNKDVDGKYVTFSYPVTGFVTHNAVEGLFSPKSPTSGVYISHDLSEEEITIWENLYDEVLSGDYDEDYDNLVLSLIESELSDCDS